jgi:small redox-active disulfide protein 2
MQIKILGTGCPSCRSLEKNVREAISGLGVEADIIKIEDIMEIMTYHIVKTPGLVLDDKVVSWGKVLTVDQIKEIISTKK